MAIGSALSALRAETVDSLVLDAGVMYVNANIADMVAATTSADVAFAEAIRSNNSWVDPNGTTVTPRKLGATRGGTRVQFNKTERQVEVDGRRTNIKGLQRVDMIDAKIVTNLIEVADVDTLKMALGSTTVTDHENFSEVKPYLYPVNTDYYGNITLFATIAGRLSPAGNELPIAIVLYNCRVNNVQEMAVEDKNEAVLQVELTAHALASDAFTIPIGVFVPKTLANLGYY